MTYDEQIEQAIGDNDIEALVRFAYGSACKCTKVKGEPVCICEMKKTSLRAKLVPLSLFEGRIQRVEPA